MNQTNSTFSDLAIIPSYFTAGGIGEFVCVGNYKQRFTGSIHAIFNREEKLCHHNYEMAEYSTICILRNYSQATPFPYNEILKLEAKQQGFPLDDENFIIVEKRVEEEWGRC